MQEPNSAPSHYPNGKPLKAAAYLGTCLVIGRLHLQVATFTFPTRDDGHDWVDGRDLTTLLWTAVTVADHGRAGYYSSCSS